MLPESSITTRTFGSAETESSSGTLARSRSNSTSPAGGAGGGGGVGTTVTSTWIGADDSVPSLKTTANVSSPTKDGSGVNENDPSLASVTVAPETGNAWIPTVTGSLSASN